MDWSLIVPIVGSIAIAVLSQIYSWRRLSTQNAIDLSSIEKTSKDTEASFQERLLRWIEMVEKNNLQKDTRIEKLLDENAGLKTELGICRSQTERLEQDLEACEEENSKHGW